MDDGSRDGRLTARTGDTAPPHPEYDPDGLCYDGERVVAQEPLGEGWAAVTTHRVLAYNPAAEGQRFESVDRPNVSGIDVDASGDRRLLGWGLRAAVYGVAALGGGGALDALNLGATLSVDAGAEAAPVGSVLAVTEALASALALLTTLLLVGGAVTVVVGLGLLGRYLRTRQPALVVERFGADPIRLSAPRADGERAATALAAALDDR
ncbi:MAG: hypothetical protein ABEJ73_12015 [Haloplanus sp.]